LLTYLVGILARFDDCKLEIGLPRIVEVALAVSFWWTMRLRLSGSTTHQTFLGSEDGLGTTTHQTLLGTVDDLTLSHLPLFGSLDNVQSILQDLGIFTLGPARDY
jgi:hypothetical protein